MARETTSRLLARAGSRRPCGPARARSPRRAEGTGRGAAGCARSRPCRTASRESRRPFPSRAAPASRREPGVHSTWQYPPASRSRRDLLEREPERILEHEHPCLGHRKLREAVAEIRAQLRELGFPVGRATRGDARHPRRADRGGAPLVAARHHGRRSASGDGATSRTPTRRGTGRSSRRASRARPGPRRARPRGLGARGAARRPTRGA